MIFGPIYGRILATRFEASAPASEDESDGSNSSQDNMALDQKETSQAAVEKMWDQKETERNLGEAYFHKFFWALKMGGWILKVDNQFASLVFWGNVNPN